MASSSTLLQSFALGSLELFLLGKPELIRRLIPSSSSQKRCQISCHHRFRFSSGENPSLELRADLLLTLEARLISTTLIIVPE